MRARTVFSLMIRSLLSMGHSLHVRMLHAPRPRASNASSSPHRRRFGDTDTLFGHGRTLAISGGQWPKTADTRVGLPQSRSADFLSHCVSNLTDVQAFFDPSFCGYTPLLSSNRTYGYHRLSSMACPPILMLCQFHPFHKGAAAVVPLEGFPVPVLQATGPRPARRDDLPPPTSLSRTACVTSLPSVWDRMGAGPGRD